MPRGSGYQPIRLGSSESLARRLLVHYFGRVQATAHVLQVNEAENSAVEEMKEALAQSAKQQSGEEK